MEQEQDKTVNQAQSQGRKRRCRKHGKGGGNPNGQKVQNNQGNQNSQKQKNRQNGNGQNGNGQKAQQPNKNNGQTAQNGNGKKGKAEQKAQPQPQQPSKKHKQPNESRPDTYAYALDGNLYINLTNKCSNGCDFCVRNERESYFGHDLWIRHGDPTAEKVIAAIEKLGDLSAFKEVVFCGFGEPTYRMEEMLALCDYLHEKGAKTRLNTNGQGNLICRRDIVPELKGKIDSVNISLNAPDAESYQKICRSMFKEQGFESLVEFGKSVKRAGISCRFSVVDCIGEEKIASCKKLCERAGVPLYVRKYISES